MNGERKRPDFREKGGSAVRVWLRVRSCRDAAEDWSETVRRNIGFIALQDNDPEPERRKGGVTRAQC